MHTLLNNLPSYLQHNQVQGSTTENEGWKEESERGGESSRDWCHSSHDTAV